MSPDDDDDASLDEIADDNGVVGKNG